jgi:PAS domain S-box-containing protein
MPTSTNRLYALTNGVLTPAALLYQCYFNGTDLEGIAFISMTFDAMMPGALSSISNLFKFVYVSAFDVTNGTTTFLYTTATQQQLTDEGVNASPQNATSEQMIGFHMKQALHMTTTAVYADRNWTIHFSANNAFIAEFAMAEKWIALFITLLLVVVLAFFVVVFAKSIQISTFLRKVTRERLVLVEENQNSLKRLLLRVESEEKKTRSTVNAIPDAIMVLNTMGSILRTNTSFDRIFGVEGKRNSKNGDITDILPDMDPMFFKTANIIDAIDTSARSALGIMIPVQVTVAPITSDESESEHLVLIKNMSDREKLVQELKRQEESAQAMMKFVTLDAQMRVESFRKQLIDYCRKEHNAESVYFLQDMLYYRNSDIDTRVKMQYEIFEKYIRNGAPMQLNITTELVKQVQAKLDNAIGNIDLFAPIEAAVKSLFMIDIYPRFIKQGEILQ